MRTSSLGLLLLVSFSLSSCGYSPVYDEAIALKRVSIPPIYRDEEGLLRNALAERLHQTGEFVYASSGARYELRVQFEKDEAEHIGYQWDKDNKGLYPNEGRRRLSLLVSLYDTQKKKNVIEPFKVDAFADFDFVNPTDLANIEFTSREGKKEAVLQYSLGQLDSEEGARSESYHPLANTLALKILSALKKH